MAELVLDDELQGPRDGADQGAFELWSLLLHRHVRQVDQPGDPSSPPTSASRIACPETPVTSEITAASLMFPASSVFCSPVHLARPLRTRAVRYRVSSRSSRARGPG